MLRLAILAAVAAAAAAFAPTGPMALRQVSVVRVWKLVSVWSEDVLCRGIDCILRQAQVGFRRAADDRRRAFDVYQHSPCVVFISSMHFQQC